MILLAGVPSRWRSHSRGRRNRESDLPGLSCNPLGQAAQINAAAPDLTVTMGLCLGHDILFHRHLEGDVTTLVVKDRVHGHAPRKGLVNA